MIKILFEKHENYLNFKEKDILLDYLYEWTAAINNRFFKNSLNRKQNKFAKFRILNWLLINSYFFKSNYKLFITTMKNRRSFKV